MNIIQLRNATVILEYGPNRILVDPMLAERGALPALKFFSGRERNPVVELPLHTDALMETVTHCLITHCQKGHFDHLDRAGKRWLRNTGVPVICTAHDAEYLRARALKVQPLAAEHHEPQPFLNGSIRTVPCLHGRGVIGRLMEHGVGYVIDMPGEPRLYLSGDTVLTPEVLDCVARYQPAVSVVPAGGARFDLGGEIIMGIDDVIAYTRAAPGVVVANHLEALNHCPVSREGLRSAAARAGVDDRMRIPADGEVLAFGEA